jgi:hypothetical protein
MINSHFGYRINWNIEIDTMTSFNLLLLGCPFKRHLKNYNLK